MCLGSQLPTTVTGIVPSLVSKKQCSGSWWVVTKFTLWPFFFRARAASTTSLSAPPMPRSGCRNVTRVIVLADDPLTGRCCYAFIGNLRDYRDTDNCIVFYRSLPALDFCCTPQVRSRYSVIFPFLSSVKVAKAF